MAVLRRAQTMPQDWVNATQLGWRDAQSFSNAWNQVNPMSASVAWEARQYGTAEGRGAASWGGFRDPQQDRDGWRPDLHPRSERAVDRTLMPTITDPATIDFLNSLPGGQNTPPQGPLAGGTPITDPDTIRMLEGAPASQGGAGSPSLLRSWLGFSTPSQPPVVPALGRSRLPITAGFAQGLRDPIDAAAALLAQGAYAIAPNQWTAQQAANVNQANTQAAANYQPPQGFDWQRAAGNVVSGVPLGTVGGAGAAALGGGTLANIGAGALTGAAQGALTPQIPASPGSPQYWGNVARDTLNGGIFGGAISTLAAPLASFGQNVINRTAPLTSQGVTPTIGQSAGGMLDYFERLAARLPLVGGPITGARQRSFGDFYRGTLNQVLSPIGESLDPSTELGRDGRGANQGRQCLQHVAAQPLCYRRPAVPE
jgi:hypothetical protein